MAVSGAAIRVSNARLLYEADEMRFDLDLGAGNILALIGPSGAGKTTLLNLIAGFEIPLEGSIEIDGVDVTRHPPHRRPVTFMFQENNLFAHLDVSTNVGLGIAPSGRLNRAARKRVESALERLGLPGFGHRFPDELSGGERQRVALARALVRDRPVLLLDEPFAALGPALRRDMLDLLAELHSERGMTIVMASHQPEDARRLATHTAFLDKGTVAACRETKALFTATDLPALDAYLGVEPGRESSKR